MMCLPATVLTWFLSYLVSTEGALSPPLNLSVDLLDFKASVRWLPGPGNPSGTRYFVEFTDIKQFSELAWTRSADCTNITSLWCSLVLDQLFTNYFVRVMAEWKEERSNWTSLLHTFQLYKDTQLSAPNMQISHDWHSVQIHLRHRVQSLREVPMRFSIDLFRMTSDHRAEYIGKKTSTGSARFVHLQPGDSYCINASAFYTQMSRHQYANVTECILMDQGHRGGHGYIGLGVAVGFLLLLIMPTGIFLIAKTYFMRSHIRADNFPKTLHIKKGIARFINLSHEEPRALPLSATDYPHAVEHAAQHVAQEDAVRAQFARIEVRQESEDESEDGSYHQKMDEEGEILPQLPDLYSLAAKMEETEDLTQEEDLILNDCVLQVTPHFSPVFTSSIEEQLQSFSSNYHTKTLESSDNETDSLYSEHFLGKYEPRPDPLTMASLWAQFK